MRYCSLSLSVKLHTDTRLEKFIGGFKFLIEARLLVCYTVVLCVITQRSCLWGGVLCDDTKDSCVADYTTLGEFLIFSMYNP